MSAHPDLAQEDAQLMVDYIMSLADPKQAPKLHPLEGTFTTQAPKETKGKGGYLLRVAHTDRGEEGLPPLSSEKIIALRNPTIQAEQYAVENGTELLITPQRSFNVIADQAYLGYHGLDLTGIGELAIDAEASGRASAVGGIIEIHLDSPDGPLLGQTEKIERVDIDFRAEMQKLVTAWEEGGKKGPRPTFQTLMQMTRPKHLVALQQTEGKHDLYLVFKNPEAKPGQVLVQMRSLTFHQTAPLEL